MAPAMAPIARPHRTRTLADREKEEALTTENTGAPGGIRTPNLLIRRSIRRVRDGSQRSLSGVESCVMILVDGLIVGRVAVSVAVSSLIMRSVIMDPAQVPRACLVPLHGRPYSIPS
jgi:hypothetical protein